MALAISKAKEDLLTRGIQARKDERARLARLTLYKARGELPEVGDMVLVRQPDKEPTDLAKLLCTPEGHEALQQSINEARQALGREQGDSNEEEVLIRLRDSQLREEVPEYRDSSPPVPWVESSDVESDAGSIDSIRGQADFVCF